MNGTLLAEVIRAFAQVRREVEGRGPGWWLAGMRNQLADVARSIADRRSAQSDVRAQLVRNAAHALLAVEAFDEEQAARSAPHDRSELHAREGAEDIGPASGGPRHSSLDGRPAEPQAAASGGGPSALPDGEA